jgi:hypothetical protein
VKRRASIPSARTIHIVLEKPVFQRETRRFNVASIVAICLFIAGCAKSGDESGFVPVTADNYVQAETDWNFAAQQAQAPINTWTHQDRVTEEN